MWTTRTWLLCAFVCILAAGTHGANRGTSRVVYGTDDRKDYFEVSASDRALGRGVALLLAGGNIFTRSGNTYTARATASAEEWWKLCSTDRFTDQQIIEANVYCTGFLISNNPPWIATASHCTERTGYVVFDYDELQDGARRTFDEDQVYTVTRIIEAGQPTGAVGDFAIMELDREVVGRDAYTEIAPEYAMGQGVHMIGHPIGLPKKFDRGGRITRVEPRLIRATVDSYGGNSGSPILDNSARLVGILVGGSTDFVESNSGCQQTNVCPGGPGCDVGETIVPICELIASNSEVANVLRWDCEGVDFSTGQEDTNSRSPADNNDNSSSGLLPSFLLVLAFLSLLTM